jgi:hypothetical protein
MKEFKKPDVKAPRFRPEKYNVLSKEFFEKFKKKYPKYKSLDDNNLRKIIKSFNQVIAQAVVDTRDGVQLPEQIGWLFIGTCQQSKKNNIDFAKSVKYGVQVTNKNWETDGKLAKIFFTNYAPKHRIKNREFWGFTACRDFKRNVSKSYPENWNMYVAVDPTQRLKLTHTKRTYIEFMNKKAENSLKTYNEFDL